MPSLRKTSMLLCDMLRGMKTLRLRLIFTLVTLSGAIPFTQISFAQAPTETDTRITTLGDRLEKRATKEELATVATQVSKLEDRVSKMGDNVGSIGTEMRVTEVIAAGLAFIGGLFIQKIIGRLMPEKG